MQQMGGASNFSTPRGPFSAVDRPRVRDGGASLQTSARHILKPQVGVAAMMSALGDIKPAWEGAKCSARSVASTTTSRLSSDEEQRCSMPYHVGRARVRDQLRLAFETPDEVAQLRRLEHALHSPVGRYDRDMQREMEKAIGQAADISQRLQATKTNLPEWTRDPFLDPNRTKTVVQGQAKAKLKTDTSNAVAKSETKQEEFEDDCDADAAALRIQSMYRGRKGREAVASMRVESGPDGEPDIDDSLDLDEDADAAAVRIQSVYRGRKDRETVAAMREEGGEVDPPDDAALCDPEMEDAAIKIQAVYRGGATRKAKNEK